jgi:ABC-type glycerol-3-phosphate transport system substrate-binding protein
MRSKNLRGRRGRLATVALSAAAAACIALATGVASSGAAPKASGGGNITVWLSGTYAGATPGTTYRKWLDGIKARYEKAYPGSTVTYKLTPINNDQFTAQITAAFASKAVPDAMLIYSGGYTTPYMKSSLLQLNKDVDSTPGFYKSQSQWDLSCYNLDCKNGKGEIYAIPNDAGTYALFYNKSLFKKAGVAAPPKTYDELLADCVKFKAKGIIPLAYGDRDGYSTDNWATYDYVSYMSKGEIAKINNGQVKYTDPTLVKPLQALVAFKKQGCVNADASTHENNDANTYFTSGKAAMVQMFPFVVGAFEKALGSKLGLAPLPTSGHGPLAGKVAGNSFHNWVIPKNAHNPTGAWDYIKMATDEQGGAALASIVGAPPTNVAASKGMKDPYARFFGNLESKIALPLLDSVIPAKNALLYYKQLQAAFAGKVTPQQAMQNVQTGQATLNP